MKTLPRHFIARLGPRKLFLATFTLVWVLTNAAHAQAPDGDSSLTELDRYRLWRARDAAVKRMDERGIAKSVEVADRVREMKDWPPEQLARIRKLIVEMEARAGLAPATAVPDRLTKHDFAYAVPRREMRNVRFARTPGADANSQSLDVYAPATGTGHSVVVWLHGGAMKGGDKAQAGILAVKPDFFVARGFAFVTVNYRLAPEHKHPAQAEDTAAALAWLRAHAVEFGGDPARLLVIGISSGGQLGAVVATNERFLAAHQLPLTTIAGAVILDIGSFDIPALADEVGDRLPEMYRYTFHEKTRRADWRDCSPYHHVAPGKGIPPMLLCYVSGRDHHARENARFAERLKASGGEATAFEAKDKTHLRIELEIGTAGDAVTAKILRFFAAPSTASRKQP